MKTDFMNGLADFLEERLGKVLFALREKNEDYRKLSDEYEALLNTQSQDIEVYRQTITKIADVGKKMGDIEKHYLFLSGMREHANINDALLSEFFEKQFTEIE